MLRWLSAVAVSWFALSVQALELTPYPNSQLLEEQERSVQNLHLVASSIRKVSGRLRAQDEIWLAGEQQRWLLQLPDGHDVRAGMDFYQRQLEAVSAQTLFQCAARSCGSSNLWANDVFNVARLYGPDKDQQYRLLLVRGEVPVYVVLYGVRRGNGRVMLLVDRVYPENTEGLLTPDLESVTEQLESRGFYDLDGSWLAQSDLTAASSFEFLLELLQQQAHLELALVAELPKARLTRAGWDDTLAHSTEQAERLKSALVDAGIDEERLAVLGIGGVLSQERGTTDPVLRLLRLY